MLAGKSDPFPFTSKPTQAPTEDPTKKPTPEPTNSPTIGPTEKPTDDPTKSPTPSPSASPTSEPSVSAEPTQTPTDDPTNDPTKSPTPSPSASPTEKPTPCDSNPCGAHGRCFLVNDLDVICACEENYYGDRCQTYYDGGVEESSANLSPEPDLPTPEPTIEPSKTPVVPVPDDGTDVIDLDSVDGGGE